MTHTILLLNGPALDASGVPVPGFCRGKIPMPRRPVDLGSGEGNGLRQQAA